RVRPVQVHVRDRGRVTRGQADVVRVEARAHHERAASVRPAVGIAPGIAVDAGLDPTREAAALRAAGVHDVPLEEASLVRPRCAGEDLDRDRNQMAAGVARGAGRVTLLAAVDDAVAARLVLARGGAAVARGGVAVITLLAGLDDAVPTGAPRDARGERRDEHGRRRRGDGRAGQERWLRRIAVLDQVRVARTD